MRINRQGLAEWAGFQVVWLVCALGAARGYNLPGAFAAAAFICLVLARTGASTREVVTILSSGAAGLVAESVLAASHLVRYAAPWPCPRMAPVWIVALWLAFGASLSGVAALLGKHRAIKAGVIGFVAGPLAYYAGERAGALEVVGAVPTTYFTIALIWAAAMPSLLAIHHRLQPENTA